ncbi:MAG TPA: mandelate racemase/muconate lactonizing enzyme family protein [Burkholderiales bacterium]|nr:mandelate racemase/muconate lactonizing enzyme family protein [Burkholderiales bacterium]
MKITSIRSCILTVPTPRPMALEFPHHKLVVAEIATDEGLQGLGYSLVFGGGGAEAVLAYLDARLKPLLLGEDALAVERLWEKMYRGDRGVRRVGIAGMALSALDIGLWDIAGQAAKLPLYRLWGAFSDRVACYGSGGWGKYTEKDLIEEAERYAAQGCRYYKMKIHDPDPLANRRRVEAVKKALGPGVRMMVDVNQKLDVAGNLRQAAVLEDLDLVWYEEPVLADDLAACAEVAHAIRIPVATGENHYTRFEFRELLERKAARYLMPDVCRANGYSETLRIARMAAAYPVAVSPHVVYELSIQVCGALANGFLVELMDWMPPDLFEELPRCADGYIAIGARAGHGMVLAPGAIAKYRSG